MADAQHGVVARRQLLAAGLSRDVVRGRLRRGLLLPLTARIRVFARRQLAAEDITIVEAIPVTAVARTLVDLAELLSYDRLLDVLTEAEQTRQFDLHALHRALDRVNHRRGPGHARQPTT
ncbi:MAG TPA: hypothetical protein VLK58_10910 [Conexibacter sp.]|nr:hypothetical protein [Conexibacter sp.]